MCNQKTYHDDINMKLQQKAKYENRRLHHFLKIHFNLQHKCLDINALLLNEHFAIIVQRSKRFILHTACNCRNFMNVITLRVCF